MPSDTPGEDEGGNEGERHVLIVDDEPTLTDVYATWLDPDYRVTAANTGDEALRELDDEVDIVLLDRCLHEWTGLELLTEFRDRGLDQPVVMVTATEPSVEIVDLPIDEYLVKPVTKDDLLSTVDLVLRLTSYDDMLQEYFSTISKLYSLLTSDRAPDFEESDIYTRLKDRATSLETDLDILQRDFDQDHYQIAFEKVLR